MYVPPPLRFSKKCKRCGLRYPGVADKCVHCTDLSDVEMDDMLLHRRQAHKNTADIGKLFLYISILIVVGFIIFSMA